MHYNVYSIHVMTLEYSSAHETTVMFKYDFT